MRILSDIKAYGRFAWGFRDFLENPLSLEDAKAILRQGLRERETNFLNLVEHGIYGYPNSPYLSLLKLARCELGDIQNMVKNNGLENTLRTLREAGVYVSFEEFKCRKPIERNGKSISVTMRDFDNPLLSRHFEVRTSQSRGLGTPVLLDLDFLGREAAAHALFLSVFGIQSRPMGVWRPVPPGIAGVLNVLCHTKNKRTVERWFFQNKVPLRPGCLKYLFFTTFIVYYSRLWLKTFPVPEHVPLSHAHRVARWLQTKREQGTPAWLDTNVSSGIRICQAAKAHGLDISGTLFRFGGEPYTPAKARIIAETDSRAISHYSTSEMGRIGLACAKRQTMDEVHLLTHKLAVIQNDRPVGDGGTGEGTLFFTTLLPGCPKIMLNVETDDHGVLVERDCGCPLQEFGFHQHLHSIRSFDKLTSEGMQFLASDILSLVEEILPDHFGGHPTDYQLVEEQIEGLPKVSIIISPNVGQVNASEVVDTVIEHLGSHKGGYEMMANCWRQGQTLQVVRGEPHHTFTGKILPLHISTKK
jgi:hypothetical protein